MPLLGLVENMSTYVCPACGHVDQIFGQDGGRRTAADLGIELLAQARRRLHVKAQMQVGQ